MIPYFYVTPLYIGPFTIHAFGVLACLGIVSGLWYAHRVAERELGGGGTLLDMAPWLLVPGFGMAHLVALVFDHPGPLSQTLVWTLLNISGGLSAFGGALGGAVGAYVFLRHRRVPVLPWLDVLARGFALAFVFGRAGCSIAHDHPGTPATFLLAMQYPARDGFPAGSRHDLGFYEFLLWLVIFPVFHWLGRHRRADGFFLGLLIVSYNPIRFGLDLLRVNDARYWGLTVAQWCCLILFPIGLRMFCRALRTPAGSPATREHRPERP